MTHAMTKGSNIQLYASAVRAVLRWSAAPGAPDIDASALLLGVDGKVRGDTDFIFYNQPRHPSGLVRHLAKTREPEGLTDTIEADLTALDPTVDRVLLAASADGGTFAQVAGGLRLLLRDASGAETIAVFDIVPETGEETALICGELYRRGGTWKFRALGQGYASGLVGLATDFGVSVDDGSGDAEAAEEGTPQPPASVPEPRGPEQAGVPEPPPEPDFPDPEPLPTPRPTPRPSPPDPVPMPEPPPGPPVPEPPPAPVPESPAVATVAVQPGYGYPPQPPGPPAPVPAYGAPAQRAAYGYPPQPDPAFTLPPQGPQFVNRQGG